VLVVAPALNTRLRYWASDTRQAQQAAEERVRNCVARLHEAGVDAGGRIGDENPLIAIGDALRFFPADEIIISTHPEHRSNWLARRLVARAARFRLPVFHIVADSTLGVEFLVAA
jgi:GNAT superfamily N-acetyltransferase